VIPIVPRVALSLALIVLILFILRLSYLVGMSWVFDNYYYGSRTR
jgi:hypothetical protein